MKGKLKQTRGITLIALIITIIVLLILAVVSIRLVVNDGILGKAEYATQKYTEEEAAEQEKLLKAEYEMAKYEGKFSGSYPEYVIDKKYPGLKIGDYVAYNEAGTGSYTADTSKGVGRSVKYNDTTNKYDINAGESYITEDLSWRVLGVNEKGELELISDTPTTEQVWLANEEGYLYGADELNKMCNTLYGNGTNGNGKVVAIGARSLNRDDIDKLLGITTEDQKKERYGSNNDYGWLYQFQYEENGSHLQYRVSSDDGNSWGEWVPTDKYNGDFFCVPGKGLILGDSVRGISEYIRNTYYVAAYWDLEDDIKKMIGCDDLHNQNTWLATQYVHIDRYGGSNYGLVCSHSNAPLYCGNSNCIDENGGHISCNSWVRPVVTLKSDIQLEYNSTAKEWKIK